MSCVSRLSCVGLPAFCVVVKPRGSQVSPIFEPWVPPAFFRKEFDVSGIIGGKLSPSHDRSAQGRIRSYGGAGAHFQGFEIPQVLGSVSHQRGRRKAAHFPLCQGTEVDGALRVVQPHTGTLGVTESQEAAFRRKPAQSRSRQSRGLPTGSARAGMGPALFPLLASQCSKPFRQVSYFERVVM